MQDATMYQILLFLILNEAQHVSSDTPPIVRSLKLHKQPVVFAYVEGCQTCSFFMSSAYIRYLTMSDNLPHMQNQRLRVQFSGS
jgi:hypothetical protein